MAQVSIYGLPQSTYVRTTRMVCQEKGIDYDLVTMAPHSDELKALNPLWRMPAFRHGDVTLFETIAITNYIDDVFPGPSLRPGNDIDRAKMTQWISAIVDYAYTNIVRQYLFPFYILPQDVTDQAALGAATEKVEATMKLFDDALAGRTYLASDQPTLADYFLAPIVYYCRRPPEASAALGRSANLQSWYGRMESRDSVRDTVPPPPNG